MKQRGDNRVKGEEILLTNRNPLTTLKELINPNEKYKRVSIISNMDNQGNEKNIKTSIFNINPDFIEIQKLFYSKSPVYYDFADIILTHSLISLFSIIIPFTPLICFFFSNLSKC